MNCSDCGQQISAARLEFLPDAVHCVGCVDRHTFQSVARIIYSHKADCELFVAKTPEAARLLNREFRRAR